MANNSQTNKKGGEKITPPAIEKKTDDTKKESAVKKISISDNTITKLEIKKTAHNVKIDDSVLITVKSNVFGQLIYVNAKSGEKTEWTNSEETQDLTMADLRSMKANQSAFFRNQWVIILGVAESSECKAKPADIYKALGITKYYENLVEPSNFKDICSWPANEIAEKVSLMTAAAQENLVIALNEYIRTGVLDSVKKIKAFEAALGCELSQAE